MHRCLRLVGSAMTTAAFLAVLAVPVSADVPASSSGGGTFTFIPNGPPRFADGNVIVSATLSGKINGTLTGTWTEQAIEVLHPGGSATTHASGTFTVATPCGAGSFQFAIEGQQASQTSPLSGVFRSIDENTSTVGIHTVDSFAANTTTFTFVYSGSYSC
jgi:hypothetical protein